MFPCQSTAALSTATQFCNTITVGGSTATNFPTRATAACGTTVDRYLSACSCGPTCSPDPTETPCPAFGGLIRNGDFECGLSSWTVQVPDTAASASLSPASNTGATSFEIRLSRPIETPEQFISARLISQTFRVEPNVPCRLRFTTFFDNPDAGFIGVRINNRAVFTIDAKDKGSGIWNTNSVDFTPGVDVFEAVIEFDFVFGNFAGIPSIDRIDSVVFDFLH
jgi:hypothetical protein